MQHAETPRKQVGEVEGTGKARGEERLSVGTAAEGCDVEEEEKEGVRSGEGEACRRLLPKNSTRHSTQLS